MKERADRELRRVFEGINSSLYAVEERIDRQIREFDPAIQGYASYVMQGQGKRLRPALTLLAASATGNGVTSDHLKLATILELIHLATLVHDDVMDGADVRRARPSANAKWGNATSVLLGDTLFAQALMLSTDFEDREINRRIASAVKEVCTGEMIQTQRRFDLKLSIAEYYRIIEMKTAALFGASTELAALLHGTGPQATLALRNYGLKLGTAYQIYDDCVDLVGDEESAGKSLGSDLQKGKLTLPLLLLLEGAAETEHARISEMVLRGTQQDAVDLSRQSIASGALAESMKRARRMLRSASEDLDVLHESEARGELRKLASSLAKLLEWPAGAA